MCDKRQFFYDMTSKKLIVLHFCSSYMYLQRITANCMDADELA